MGFYTSASFFIALAALLIPAACLGLAGRRIKPYGMAASWAMVALLFEMCIRDRGHIVFSRRSR